MPKGLPGYPNPRSIRNEALALARAAVPTKRSITGQYDQSIDATSRFTSALMGLLGQSQPGAGYDQAVQQQSAVGAAAAARLAALGGQYGAGSAAAVGGLGDSALSSLIARGAAAKAYGSQLPAVAGARGQLFQQGLIHDRQTALQNRADQLRSAFTQSLDQVQQQALARATALASIQQNNRAFRESRREFNIGQAFNQQQLGFQQQQAAQQQQNWAYEHSPQWLGLQAHIQALLNGQGGGSGPLATMTPTEISTARRGAFSAITGDDLAKRFKINDTIQKLVTEHGIPRPLALSVAMSYYATAPGPTKADFTDSNQNFDQAGYTKAVKSYKAILADYKKFASTQGFRLMARRWLGKHKNWVTTPPGYQH